MDASEMAERLWRWFQDENAEHGCPCGCTWNGRLWEHRDRPDELMFDHIAMDAVDPQPVTRLENHWRHFQRWGHDGGNPYGGRAVALPTWISRNQTVTPRRPPMWDSVSGSNPPAHRRPT